MDTVIIRNHIEQARRHEESTHELGLLLQARLGDLHSCINVRAPEPHLQLMLFVTTFIERTPELLDTVMEVSRNAPWEEHSEGLVSTCEGFFISPLPLLEGRNGMNGLMAKSYLCHRLVEEVNDCYRIFCHYPLIPVDFTTSNLIIHHLIGEPLANVLDQVVDNEASKLQGFAGLQFPGDFRLKAHEELQAICQRRKLMDENLEKSVFISSIFPGCTIH